MTTSLNKAATTYHAPSKPEKPSLKRKRSDSFESAPPPAKKQKISDFESKKSEYIKRIASWQKDLDKSKSFFDTIQVSLLSNQITKTISLIKDAKDLTTIRKRLNFAQENLSKNKKLFRSASKKQIDIAVSMIEKEISKLDKEIK